MKHPLADILIAIAEGKEIQMFANGKWKDKKISGSAGISLFSGFNYRIKPETKKYRVALLTYGTEAADNAADAAYYESLLSFIRWITDWVEYEDGSS